jgi:hypothetical protein
MLPVEHGDMSGSALLGLPLTPPLGRFINLGSNPKNDQNGFVAFGVVASLAGMQVVDAFYSGYGELNETDVCPTGVSPHTGLPCAGPTIAGIVGGGSSYLKTGWPQMDFVTGASVDLKRSGSSMPTPATWPRPDYTVRGAIEVDTNENTLFQWEGELYVLENIPCYYSQHASKWDPAYNNSSYARIRRMDSGKIVVNISSTIGFGFVSAFVDETPPGRGSGAPAMWLFGSRCNRCPHTPKTRQGCAPNRTVQSWRAVGSLLHWESSAVGGTFETFNVQVSRVTTPPESQLALGLPLHRYVMIMEIGDNLFAVNNAADGDLTKGWEPVPGVNNHFGNASGGPSIRFNPLDSMYAFALASCHPTTCMDLHALSYDTCA